MTTRKILNPAINGEGKTLVRTIKANYYKMGVRNFLFTKNGDRFCATSVMEEYEECEK